MDGAEKAAWSHSVRNWESSLQNLNLRATSKGEIETQPLRGQESHCGAARCVYLPQGGRGMVAELAAAELPGSQRKGKLSWLPSSSGAARRLIATWSERPRTTGIGAGPQV